MRNESTQVLGRGIVLTHADTVARPVYANLLTSWRVYKLCVGCVYMCVYMRVYMRVYRLCV